SPANSQESADGDDHVPHAARADVEHDFLELSDEIAFAVIELVRDEALHAEQVRIEVADTCQFGVSAELVCRHFCHSPIMNSAKAHYLQPRGLWRGGASPPIGKLLIRV